MLSASSLICSWFNSRAIQWTHLNPKPQNPKTPSEEINLDYESGIIWFDYHSWFPRKEVRLVCWIFLRWMAENWRSLFRDLSTATSLLLLSLLLHHTLCLGPRRNLDPLISFWRSFWHLHLKGIRSGTISRRRTTIWAIFHKLGCVRSLDECTLFIIDLVDDVLEHFIDVRIRLGTRLDVLHVILLS